jgi:hypothetical protein
MKGPEYHERWWTVLGLLLVLVVLGFTVRMVLRLHSLPRSFPHTRPTLVEVTDPTTTIFTVDTLVAPSVPSFNGIFLDYVCPNNPSIRLRIGDFGWTRSNDPVLHPTPNLGGLTLQKLIQLYKVAC